MIAGSARNVVRADWAFARAARVSGETAPAMKEAARASRMDGALGPGKVVGGT